MTVHELVRSARTIRRFDESDRIGADILRLLVDIARVCPCGGNQQKLRYRLVSDPAECRVVFPLTAWAGALKDWPGPAEGERPTGYIAILGESAGGMDTGIVAQVMQLAAYEMGFGCCMLGSIQRDDLKKSLSVPDPYMVQLLLAFGRPAERVVLEEISAGDDVNYYRTADGVHHVPKLGLDDVIVGG